MNHNSEAAVIANDLDSLRHRIEALPAHPNFTAALIMVTDAARAVTEGRAALHESDMRKRFAAMGR